MSKSLFLSAIFLAACLVSAQPTANLVLNPSFEKFVPGKDLPPCSYVPNAEVFTEAVANWSAYHAQTPDLIIWKPDAWYCIFPKPHGGSRMAGIITYHPRHDTGRDKDFHEFVEGRLRFPLEVGKKYRVEFFVQQADSVARHHLQTIYGEKRDILPTAAGNLGIAFLNKPAGYFEWGRFQPQFVVREPVVTQRDEWRHVSGEFVAEQPWQFFAIGNFSSDAQTPVTLENPAAIDSFNIAQDDFLKKKRRVAYYLLDDVSVVPADAPPPPAAAIAADLKRKKAYVFKNVNFESGKWDLLPEALPELDGLAVFLKKHPGVKVEIGGHTDSVGKEEDNRLLSENRAKAVSNYLAASGIAAERLSFRGYGESVPAASNDAEEGRLANRRVECRLIP